MVHKCVNLVSPKEQLHITATLAAVTEQAAQQAQAKFTELDKELNLSTKAAELGQQIEATFVAVSLTLISLSPYSWINNTKSRKQPKLLPPPQSPPWQALLRRLPR